MMYDSRDFLAEKDFRKKPDWVIHAVLTGECDHCGSSSHNQSPVSPYLCDAHTHGLTKYQNRELQLVLNLPPEDIVYILNTIGRMMQKGVRFQSGDTISYVFSDCLVRLDEYWDSGAGGKQKRVLRIIVPDGRNQWPEDPKCDDAFRLQTLPTKTIYTGQYLS